MMPDGKSRAFFPADGDLVGLDELADVLESDRRLVKFDFVEVRERVDQVGSGDRLSDPVLPTSCFDQVIEEQSDDIVGLEKCSVRVNDAEAVGVTIRSDSDARASTAHLLAGSVE